MVSYAAQSPTSDLAWLLSGLVDKVPDTRSAVLLSSDGIPMSWHGLDQDNADYLAALASGLCSQARATGAHFGNGDHVHEVVAQLDGLLVFICMAGPGAVLAVLAGPEAEAGTVGYEMTQLVKALPSYLSTPARHVTATAHDTSR